MYLFNLFNISSKTNLLSRVTQLAKVLLNTCVCVNNLHSWQKAAHWISLRSISLTFYCKSCCSDSRPTSDTDTLTTADHRSRRPAAAAEDRSDQWSTVVISDKEYRLDLKVIEPYKRVISHGGKWIFQPSFGRTYPYRSIVWSYCGTLFTLQGCWPKSRFRIVRNYTGLDSWLLTHVHSVYLCHWWPGCMVTIGPLYRAAQNNGPLRVRRDAG